MGFDFRPLDEAKAKAGMRMIVVSGVPSPWTEAAKGIFHLKGIEWIAVRHDAQSAAQQDWAFADNAPVAIYDDEKPRAGWSEILLLAERVGSGPKLIPSAADERAALFGLAHELMSEQGLCWSRRLQIIDLGLQAEGPARGFAEYRALKYGHSIDAMKTVEDRIVALLQLISARLSEQKADGSAYLFNEGVSALDIYSAVSMALFKPLPEDVCTMDPLWRGAFSMVSGKVGEALDPILFEHRDLMYRNHLVTPLSL